MTENSAQTKKRAPWGRTGAIIVLCLLALTAMGATLAAKVETKTADNILTFGDVKIRVVETEWDASAGEEGTGGWVEMDPNSAIDAHHGKVERRVQFENVGSHPIFVRAKMDMLSVTVGEAGEEATAPVPAENLTYGLNTNPDPSTGEFEIGWTVGDAANPEQAGWYYYNAVLEPGETTEPLVTSIEMSDYNDLAQAVDSFRFDVLGQGVQSEHQVDETTGEAITHAADAYGWPDPNDDGVNHEAATQSNVIADVLDEMNEGVSAMGGNATKTEEGQE